MRLDRGQRPARGRAGTRQALAPAITALTTWALFTVACPAAAGAAQSTDDGIRARIARIRAATPAIRVDGRDEEWTAVPAIPDPTGDADSASRDITSVSLVPTDDGLVVRLTTAGPPDPGDRVFWLDVDIAGGRLPELQIGLAARGPHHVRIFDAAGRPRSLRRVRFPASVGDIVELALPMSLLEEMLPDAGPLRGSEARPWVRVVAFTWTPGGAGVGDYAAAASYRLVEPPGSLDAALPRADAEAVATRLPVAGRWLVSQGPFGYATHARSWAWDLTVADATMAPAEPRDSCANSDFFAWGADVRAPAAGRVLTARGDAPDEPACGRPSREDPNGVLLDLGAEGRLWLAHLQRGSVAGTEGERVVSGALLGRVGNSGLSAGPHLHLEAFAPGGGAAGPLELLGVRVSLNAIPGDPWARDLPRWVPRPGLFVESTPAPHRPDGAGTPAPMPSSDLAGRIPTRPRR